ncbi:MAG: BON domain-containing protein [Caldimicrobium sp.]|nr:BON domain-containing protein [Caldimicrobium sp.]MCX7872854.1 BON domain-containing protein [Caldimicrobium sp.]MDW8093567.1 BON domain-containing protein [Caldimicrobium sp.]
MIYFKLFIGNSKVSFKIFKNLCLGIFLSIFLSGCGWVLVGGGAYEGYKVATDPRTIGTQVDDAIITTKIKAKLVEDPLTKARKIDVDTVNGVVTLTGFVDSEEEIRRAIEIAQSVPGVKKVVNNLKVGKRGLKGYISDKKITARIKAKFIADPEIKALSIDVDTLNGVVTLTGVVKREEQRRRAVELAKTVEGVREVIVNILVKGDK